MTTDASPSEAELSAIAELTAAADPPEDHEADEPWRITNDGEAAWALRKVRSARAERARIAGLAQEELDRISDWASREDTGPARDEAYFTAHLERYAREQRDAGRKRISTPHGTVTTRPGQMSLKVDDEAMVVEFLTQHAPHLVRSETRVSIPVAALKKEIVAEGQDVFWPALGVAIPGARVEWSPTSVTLTPVGGADPEDAGEYTEDAVL